MVERRSSPGPEAGSPSSSYDRKRDFEATPEPEATTPPEDVDPLTAPPGERFVIQQHYATRLHHDVRLEMFNGDLPVLVSWAVPKGLPRTKEIRALAIRTEDHPIDYLTFSGAIPESNYGAGEVRIFDQGSYEMVDRSDDRITFVLKGERQPGRFHLVKTGVEDGKEQWLALLSQDARPQADPLPEPAPMLATSAKTAFDDPAWGFEPKWDGIRALAYCDTTTRLMSRNRKDVTAAYPELSRLHDRLVALDAVLDGEIVAFDDGKPSFQRLQQRMHVRDQSRIEQLSRQIPVVYMVFDLLYLDGRDITTEPLTERKRRLEEAIVPSETIQLSPMVEGRGKALFEAASEQGLEGVVAKQLASLYELGRRSRAWLKVKLVFDADVVIVGWTPGEGRRRGKLGSLVMAVYEEGRLRYVGNVGTGFDDAGLREARERLEERATDEPPFETSVIRSHPELRTAQWVRPELVAMVEHRQLTDAGKLRAPSFKAFRDDKAPEECTFDQL